MAVRAGITEYESALHVICDILADAVLDLGADPKIIAAKLEARSKEWREMADHSGGADLLQEFAEYVAHRSPK